VYLFMLGYRLTNSIPFYEPASTNLLPYCLHNVQPKDDASFDVHDGTSGWTSGAVSSHSKVKRDTTLVG
jgi:hypothetical protein